MRALLVINAQNTIIDFKAKGEPDIFIRNIDENEDSPFHKKADTSFLHHSLKQYTDHIIEKKHQVHFFKRIYLVPLKN